MGQVFKFDQISEKLRPFRQKKIVFTNGVFDLLHVGHVRYLKEARALGDFLFIGVNADASVKRLKGNDRPLQNENDRAEILSSLVCVDAVVIFSDDTPEKLIHEVKPSVLVKGGDWKIESIVGASFVQSLGGEVFSLQFVDGKSTTQLIQKART